MIVGNDLDSLLSAALLKKIFGWNIVGFYDYCRLWFDIKIGSQFIAQLEQGRFVAIDLDIYRNTIPSVGHHIIQCSQQDQLPEHNQSLNPNLIFGIDCRHYTHKYPLATVHLLRWLFGIELDRRGDLLCWLADSAYINAQSHRFRENVARWLYHFFDWRPYWEIFILLDSADYEELLIQEIGSRLRDVLPDDQPGQVTSRFNALSGWQCQWSDPAGQSEQIRKVFEFIHELTAWTVPELPQKYLSYQGQRVTISVQKLLKRYGSLDRFLNQENPFSYVFPFMNTMNYTLFSIMPTADM